MRLAIPGARQFLAIFLLLLPASFTSGALPPETPAPQPGEIAPSVPAAPPEASGADENGTEPREAARADGQGQEANEIAELSIEELMDVVVVTASRREQSIRTVPFAVSVITAEDIRRSGARSITDALRLVPGVDVAQLHYGNAAVSVRGMHGFLASSTLVLVDGRQIYDLLFGGTIWGAWPFHVEDIERIEVVRGPGGVAWGPDALSGVINIITKDPGAEEGVSLSLRGGSRGTADAYTGYGSKLGDWRYRVSTQFERSDGFREGGSWIKGLDDPYLAVKANARAVLKRGAERFDLSLGSSVVDSGYPLGPMITLANQNAETQSNYLLGNWSTSSANDQSIHVTGYVNDFWFGPGRAPIEYRYQQVGFLVGMTSSPAEGHTLSLGLDSRLDLFDATNADPHLLSRPYVSSGRTGVYIQDDWQIRPQWTLSGGGRVDYDAYGGFEPSGRLSLSYQYSESSFFYGSIAHAAHIQPPPLRFLDIPIAGGLVRFTSDRDVEASGVLAYELGYRGRVGSRFEHSAALFRHDYSDVALLFAGPGPPGLLRLNFQNGVDPSSYGFEWEGRFRATDRLVLVGNYTFERLDNDTSFQTESSTDLLTTPESKAMLGAQYAATDKLRLSSYVYFVGDTKSPNPEFPLVRRDVPSYVRWDLRAERSLWKNTASIAVGVQNILDDDHFEGASLYFSSAEVPRMFYVEFRATIK